MTTQGQATGTDKESRMSGMVNNAPSSASTTNTTKEVSKLKKQMREKEKELTRLRGENTLMMNLKANDDE